MSNSDLDLTVRRAIEAPRAVVWTAWKDPKHFVNWWAPAPVVTISNKHEFYTGGGFDTTMRLEDGTVMEGGEGCFLQVIENERIVFTDALQGGWRPNEEGFFSAIITLEDHPDGTLYTATALHKNRENCEKHEEMGFVVGWETALGQLAKIAEELA
ncbi:SRPBCC family protein [Microbulbifer spongiae]|uniref:SRPBCC family protein n=1 Tax=Microbulbifer spongiae TaxID=2944933 RepID=A0ABY9ECI0_9GAMM|nr:SRPBCC family protein [Microbulbifer sp. MI-G]WKD49666.1 SRPBCC family protein [Microbulbifer sp. MI-G]